MPKDDLERLLPKRLPPKKPRREARPGERKVKVRCGKCSQVWADAHGDEHGMRDLDGFEMHTGEDDTGRRTLQGYGGRPHTRMERGAGKAPEGTDWTTLSAELIAAVEQANTRMRFRCRRRCGVVLPVLRDRLDDAFTRAVAERRSSVYLPDDLRS